MNRTSSGLAAETKTKNDSWLKDAVLVAEDAHLCTVCSSSSRSVCLLSELFLRLCAPRSLACSCLPQQRRPVPCEARTELIPSLTHRMNMNAAAQRSCSYSCWCPLDTDASLGCVWLLTSALLGAGVTELPTFTCINVYPQQCLWSICNPAFTKTAGL